MANKVLLIRLEGPEEFLVPAVEAYASSFGWQLSDGGLSAEQAAREPLRAHMLNVVQGYFRRQAEAEAGRLAEESATAALGAISMTLTIEDVDGRSQDLTDISSLDA